MIVDILGVLIIILTSLAIIMGIIVLIDILKGEI